MGFTLRSASLSLSLCEPLFFFLLPSFRRRRDDERFVLTDEIQRLVQLYVSF